MTIQHTAVIGAGTMGSGIAAHMANAGARVLLLDIVPDGAKNRNALAEKALKKMKESKRSPFTHPRHAEQITTGNLEDDLDKLAEVDWIVEAIVEDGEIKREWYGKIDKVRKKGSVIASNTSTIPLAQLKEGQSDALKQDLCITHFFNPPRQMRLVEMVSEEITENQQDVRQFLEARMGKTIVDAKDTPGFIANRIGIYWMMYGLEQAIDQEIPVETADQLLGEVLGFPGTGIFGLMDLIGLDLMLDITKSLQSRLPENDPYQDLEASVALIEKMVDDGLTGLKGDGGFYKKTEDGKQVRDLSSGEYREPDASNDPAIKAAQKEGLQAALTTESDGGRYAWAVLSEVLRYTASLVPEVAERIIDVDQAMTLGFNWKQGPFEMMDAMGSTKIDGASWFADALREDGREVPKLLELAAKNHAFYQVSGEDKTFLSRRHAYQPMPKRDDQWQLADKIRGKKPILKNEAARLWDLGDGIAGLQLTRKMDTMDHATFDLIEQALEKVEAEFDGMIIGDDDAHFSAGLDLKKILNWCENEDWEAIESILKRGQEIMMAIKYAPFPVVGAPSGKALGGACELLLHCDAVQAHIESQIGLVEVNIGVVPSWGGCEEMLVHHLSPANDPASEAQAVERVFRLIASAQPSASAEEAKEMKILGDKGGITMHRQRLLPDAKRLCQQLAQEYQAPERSTFRFPPGTVKEVLDEEIKLRSERKELRAHDQHVLRALAYVLSGGEGSPEIVQDQDLAAVKDRASDHGVTRQLSEEEILELERKAFMVMIQSRPTQEKIRKVL